MLTHSVSFTGSRLALNYATSAAGSVRVELSDWDGQALPGFGLADAVELIGDEIDGYARWKAGMEVGAVMGRVRLRFHLKDADV